MSTLLKIGRSFSLVYPADLYKYGIIFHSSFLEGVFWSVRTNVKNMTKYCKICNSKFQDLLYILYIFVSKAENNPKKKYGSKVLLDTKK